MKKNMISLNYLKVAILGLSLAVFTQSCTKDVHKDELKINGQDQLHKEKVLKFLSVILNVDVNMIKTNENTQEFYIPECNYTISITDVEKHYDIANVYKLEYE